MMEKEKRKKKINMFLYETEISCSRLSVRDGASYLDDNMILRIRHLLPFQPWYFLRGSVRGFDPVKGERPVSRRAGPRSSRREGGKRRAKLGAI